jgi:hypothetical protein
VLQLRTTPRRRIGEWRYSSTHSLTSALDGGEWSGLHPGRFSPRERAPGTYSIGGWMGPRAVLDAVVKRKIPSPRRESNPRTSIVQPIVQSQYRLSCHGSKYRIMQTYAGFRRNLLGLSGMMMMMMMMMIEMVFETLVQYGHLTWLIAREDYIKFNLCSLITIKRKFLHLERNFFFRKSCVSLRPKLWLLYRTENKIFHNGAPWYMDIRILISFRTRTKSVVVDKVQNRKGFPMPKH